MSSQENTKGSEYDSTLPVTMWDSSGDETQRDKTKSASDIHNPGTSAKSPMSTDENENPSSDDQSDKPSSSATATQRRKRSEESVVCNKKSKHHIPMTTLKNVLSELRKSGH